MSLLVAESLLACGGLDEADLYRRFQAWLAGAPKDIGVQTRAVLSSPLGWDESAATRRRAIAGRKRITDAHDTRRDRVRRRRP